MQSVSTRLWFACAIWLCAAFPAFSAERPAAEGAAARGGGRAPALVSPEIHEDFSVTFRIRAPEADAVELGGIMTNQSDMDKAFAKSDDGVWSLKVGPLAPDIYYYYFVVDGVQTLDTGNPRLKASNRALQNVLEVRASEPQYYDLRPDVPHGIASSVYYFSKALNELRQMTVYTPPDYLANPDQKYPVLYLLHGTGDNERAWMSEGRATLTLDNLIAGGEAVPMIVVMPFGQMPRSTGGAAGGDLFTTDLLEAIMPEVEKNFRVLTGPENTAIAGLSMGGGQTLRAGFGNPDKFAWIGAFSSAISGRDNPDARFLDAMMKSPDTAKDDYRLIWIGCGKADGLFAANERLAAELEAAGIPHTWHVTEGGHVWPLWRDYLHLLYPLLFKAEE